MTSIDRRSFLKGSVAGLAGAAALGLAGCAPEKATPVAETGSGSQTNDDWLGEPPFIDEGDIAQTVDVDVLVCGAGTAGIFAAAKAAVEGLKVLAIDHGNHTEIKSAIGSIGNSYQRASGVVIDKNEILNDMERYAIAGTDRRILNVWADRSGEAVDFFASYMEKAGLPMVANEAASYPDTYHQVWLIELGLPGDLDPQLCMESGEKTPAAVVEDITSRGSEVRYGTSLIKLEQDDSGAVIGAIIQNEDRTYARVNASKGVVLATGGYASNEDMLAALQPETLDMIANYQMTTNVPGDGIKAGLWAGGVMQESHCSMIFDRAALPPTGEAGLDYVTEGQYFSLSSQPWLKVNLDGERFMNESALYESAPRASLNQRGHCYCVIYDATWQEQAPKMETHGCSRFYPYPDANIQSAGNVMAIQTMMDGFLEDGRVVQADTIADLAKGLGIPAENLEQTVVRYNELCESGVDEDFGKEPFRMQPVATPPFYGFRCAGNLLCTLDGLQISPKAEVLDAEHNPIPGLYAAGNDAGGFYSTCYPSLMIGLNAGRCITFAYVAAEELAKR